MPLCTDFSAATRLARKEITQTFRYLVVDHETGSDREVFESVYVPFAGPCGLVENGLPAFVTAAIPIAGAWRFVEFIPFAGEGRTVGA